MKSLGIFLFLSLPLLAWNQTIDLSLFENLEARNIGPAGMSGRVTAVEAVHTNPDIIYAGTASGGLWKSESGGVAWEPIFDDQMAASIGAVAIDQSNPDVIWVGTGEGNPRNSLNLGYGIYKSLDGGRSWKLMGLEHTRAIHRVIIHPWNSDIVYAGSIGSPWGEHEERGVYRTRDGGKTWEKVLYVNEKTGVADLVMDPSNPNKLVAAMWEHRRWPWYFNSGGPGSGLYITHDGGDHWTQRTAEDGLPEGDLGRIGLAISAADPDRIYAFIESKSNGMFRSDDGGFSWRRVSKAGDESAGSRPFYYADIFADPKNENRVYSLHTTVTESEDGGRSFSTFVNPRYIHVDNHAYYIHPDNPEYIILGNDGGLAITRDRGETWRACENLPIGQFYHIRVDNEVPYNVAGGMQDNGSWLGPSQVWRQGGIRNMFWNRVGGGDGFDVVPDPLNPRYGYSMSQGGSLNRYDLETGDQHSIRPVHPDGEELRFNWNAAIGIDPHDQTTIYYGAQYLLRSSDHGRTWEVISPDLTTNDPEKQKQRTTGGLTTDNSGAENFTTIICIEPSPVQEGVIWVGTDDGNVQLTRDGGQNWTNMVENIEGVAPGSWVTQIRASTYRAGEAVVVFDDHRRDNWEPYVFRTTDFGRNWDRLVDSNDVWGYALSFVQDPVEPNLMFVGTEFGMYVSIDGGNEWTKWTNGYPTVPTMDMAIQTQEHDLVIGTYGRSIYVIDDIRPLRALAADGWESVTGADLYAFEIPRAFIAQIGQNMGYRSTGHAFFAAENRPFGALLSYFVGADLPEGNKEKVKVEIRSGGKVVRTLYDEPEEGFNRMVWRLERDGFRFPGSDLPGEDEEQPSGQPVQPGTYEVSFSFGENTITREIEVLYDPRVEVDQALMDEKDRIIAGFGAEVEEITLLTDRLQKVKTSMEVVGKAVAEASPQAKESYEEKAKEFNAKLKELHEMLEGREVKQGFSRDPEALNSHLSMVRRLIGPAHVPVTENLKSAMENAREKMAESRAAIDRFFSEDWQEFQRHVEELDINFAAIMNGSSQ